MKETPTPLLLIELLADGNIHSGEQLGEGLGMTRAGINKHIQTLRSWGIDVQTVAGKGYQLDAPMNLLNADIVNQNIKGEPASVIPVIDSTNQYLIQRISELKSGDVCIAEYQSAGRGRRGRQWISPFGRNLYLSMYWKLDQGPAAAIGLSLVVGVIMAEVLEKLGADGVKVKWPNDLYLNDKKLSGILVELTGKTGDVAHIVTGIGINIAMSKNQNEAINQQWINLEQVGIKIDRNELACEITNALREAFVQFEKTRVICVYRALETFR
ncbi:biotin--[acetyl-CoA-carboxylase] ligase [Proteus penneri ATCC 35198]|nr:biotin--[acetyl-CoA-carboxylase] ligase [Proteus penneri ATCC 35198]